MPPGKPKPFEDKLTGQALDALTRIKMHELLFKLVEIHRPTVLFKSDRGEALILSDRIVVMDDGAIALDRRLNPPHPRKRSDARVERYRDAFMAALGVEITL